ncbi:MAG TPA: copper transporter [Acidimicrobiia bacterium]|jgi:hypothetical protein
MINFRFHLASLIAIFLALALGVVVGAGVIDRGVVDTLNSRLDNVESRANRIQDDNNQLRDDNGKLTSAIEAQQCYVMRDQLLGEDVGIVAVRGVDESTVKKAVAAVECGGGNVTGILWIEPKWALTSDSDVAALADALGSSSKKATTVRSTAWRELAARLKTPPADGATDLLATLEDAGFVTYESVNGDATLVADFPARGASILLVVGEDGKVPDKDVVLPAATALSNEGLPLVVGDVYVSGDDRPDRGAAVSSIRDGSLASKVSTVDDLDWPQGPATAGLALSDLRQVPPLVGHYGLSTDKLMPDVAQ